MAEFRICLISGWCGNLRLIVADHVQDMLVRAGYKFRLEHQSVWDNPAPPSRANLVLQLLPAFTKADTGCPVVDIKLLLADPNHQPTLEKILRQMEQVYPIIAGQN